MTTFVIRHATVVTVDADNTVIDDGTIVVEHGVITHVLPSHVEPFTHIDHHLDAGGAIVMPGLINTHTHQIGRAHV